MTFHVPQFIKLYRMRYSFLAVESHLRSVNAFCYQLKRLHGSTELVMHVS